MPYSSMSVEQAGIEWFIGTGAPIQVRLFTCNEIALFQENQAAISSPNSFKSCKKWFEFCTHGFTKCDTSFLKLLSHFFYSISLIYSPITVLRPKSSL
jgi:hypothetical protein